MTTANSQWLRPFKAEPYAQWNGITGGNVTVTVCGVVNSGTLPLNDEIWMDVEYLTSSSQPNPTQFDGAPNAGATTSNGNLTVTHNNTTNAAGVASSTFLIAGKYYFEITATLQSLGDVCGAIIAGGSFSNYMSGVSIGLGIICGTANTFVYANGGLTSKNLGITSNGDVFGFAFDLTSKFGWVRRNAGNWNGDAAANPATGVGGVVLAVIAMAPCVGFTNAGATNNMTANFGVIAYANAAPSGFGNWISAPAPLGKIVTTTKANVLASGTSVTSDSSSWNNLSSSFNGTPTANVTMSNNNLTVTWISSSTQGVSSLAEYSTGKYYIEFKITYTTIGLSEGVGFKLSGISLTNFASSSTVGSCSYMWASTNGEIWIDGTLYDAPSGKALGQAVSNDVACAAFDLDNHLVWWRRNNGNWNNTPTANPATGVGGLPFVAGAYVPTVKFSSSGAAKVVTGNFGASAYAFTPPAGFDPWNKWTSFKLTTTLSSPQPGLAGYIHVRPRVAKASSLFYIDPQINLS